MPNVITPIERWFDNLRKIQIRMKDLNHLTPDGLKLFSTRTLNDLIPPNLSEHIRENLNALCQAEGIGGVDADEFADMTINFVTFLDNVGVIPIQTALRFQIHQIAVNHNHALIGTLPGPVMRMKLDEVFGPAPLSSNLGKKMLDVTLNRLTPDDFYPIDGSFLSDGNKKLNEIVKQIIS
jgi:hypothetical protein